jgi:hypothetical protein
MVGNSEIGAIWVMADATYAIFLRLEIGYMIFPQFIVESQ